MSNVLR